MYMLDTNICIYVINRRPLEILEKFESLAHDSLCISVVTRAELQYGVEKSSNPGRNQRILDQFLLLLIEIPWHDKAAVQYGKIRKRLEENGSPIGNMDLLIAAHAVSENYILVTNNLREFGRVEGLVCENWL